MYYLDQTIEEIRLQERDGKISKREAEDRINRLLRYEGGSIKRNTIVASKGKLISNPDQIPSSCPQG